MDIQQTDRESLATYVHRFKWEASRCKFNNDATTIRNFLKGLKNAHTIATKVYKKRPQTLAEAIKEVEKLKATQQLTSTLLPTSLVNTMSSDNGRCFKVKKSAIWHAVVPIYGASIVIIMDTLPWTAWIRYHHLAHQHIARSNATNRHDRSSSRHHSHTRHSHHAYKDRSRFSCPSPAHVTIDIGVAAIITPIGAALVHSTDLPVIVSDTAEAQVLTAITMTHCTADLHLIGILPEMTADLKTNPEHNNTNRHKDPLSTSQATPWMHKDKRHKQVTIDDPPSEYYSSDDHDSNLEDDLK